MITTFKYTFTKREAVGSLGQW